MARVTTLAAAFLLVALSASAQQPGSPPRVPQRGGVEQPVHLQFQEGRVTLRAQNAPVRAILAEWARLGGATIVNGDRVTGPPLTLELTGVPERQALDIVLRTVAGYMLAPRRTGATGASAFDRIMILPTSVAPRNPPPTPAATGRPSPVLPRPPVARPPAPAPVPAPGVVLADEPADDVEADDPDPALPADTVVAPPPTQPRALPRPLVRPPVMVPGSSAGPELVPEQPDPEVAQPATQPAVLPTPGNPFGIPAGSSTMPGVIAPVPRQQQPDRVQ
jgi:hypothetical protein